MHCVQCNSHDQWSMRGGGGTRAQGHRPEMPQQLGEPRRRCKRLRMGAGEGKEKRIGGGIQWLCLSARISNNLRWRSKFLLEDGYETRFNQHQIVGVHDGPGRSSRKQANRTCSRTMSFLLSKLTSFVPVRCYGTRYKSW